MVVCSSIILPVFTGWRISDVLFYLYVSIVVFAIFLPSSWPDILTVASSWGLFLLLLGLSLWRIRKIKNRTIRIGGQILTILVFAGVFIPCHYYAAKAIASAIAAISAAMSH
jgi:hypothetical protein